MRRVHAWLVLAGTLLLSACGPAPGGSVVPSAAPTSTRVSNTVPPAAVSPLPVIQSPGPSPQAQLAVDAALRDAATHLGVSPSDLHVEQVEARQWSDASLGCPRQGVLYAQVLTPGYVVVIAGAGKQLEYHADERGRVVLCQER